MFSFSNWRNTDSSPGPEETPPLNRREEQRPSVPESVVHRRALHRNHQNFHPLSDYLIQRTGFRQQLENGTEAAERVWETGLAQRKPFRCFDLRFQVTEEYDLESPLFLEDTLAEWDQLRDDTQEFIEELQGECPKREAPLKKAHFENALNDAPPLLQESKEKCKKALTATAQVAFLASYLPEPFTESDKKKLFSLLQTTYQEGDGPLLGDFLKDFGGKIGWFSRLKMRVSYCFFRYFQILPKIVNAYVDTGFEKLQSSVSDPTFRRDLILLSHELLTQKLETLNEHDSLPKELHPEVSPKLKQCVEWIQAKDYRRLSSFLAKELKPQNPVTIPILPIRFFNVRLEKYAHSQTDTLLKQIILPKFFENTEAHLTWFWGKEAPFPAENGYISTQAGITVGNRVREDHLEHLPDFRGYLRGILQRRVEAIVRDSLHSFLDLLNPGEGLEIKQKTDQILGQSADLATRALSALSENLSTLMKEYDPSHLDPRIEKLAEELLCAQGNSPIPEDEREAKREEHDKRLGLKRLLIALIQIEQSYLMNPNHTNSLLARVIQVTTPLFQETPSTLSSAEIEQKHTRFRNTATRVAQNFTEEALKREDEVSLRPEKIEQLWTDFQEKAGSLRQELKEIKRALENLISSNEMSVEQREANINRYLRDWLTKMAQFQKKILEDPNFRKVSKAEKHHLLIGIQPVFEKMKALLAPLQVFRDQPLARQRQIECLTDLLENWNFPEYVALEEASFHHLEELINQESPFTRQSRRKIAEVFSKALLGLVNVG